MNLSTDSHKPVVPFVVSAEVFAQLDPIEKIVIKDQARRGLVILKEGAG